MKDDTKVIEKDERSEWVAPTIKEWDVVAETQSSYSGTGPDNAIYS